MARIPRSFYDDKKKLICLEIKPGAWYKIPLSMVGTKEAFIDFIYHINAKKWSTPTKLKQFIDLCDEASQKEYKDSLRGVFECYGAICKKN